jgi:Rieske Fe-S protein
VNGTFDCAAGCPYLRGPGEEERFGVPVGYVRRVAGSGQDVDETRRNLLKLAAVAGVLGVGVGGAVGGALQYVQPPTVGIGSYPRTQLFDIDGSPLTITKVQAEYSVATSDLFLFDYPLRNEPNFFLNLAPSPQDPTGAGATNVSGGVGPSGSIVAFSAICQHLGCPAPAISYYPPGTCPKTFGSLPFYIHCSCHGSTYDVTKGAANLTGPAVLPLPQVVLEEDSSGNLFAVGMTPSSPPVNGHLDTLQGDSGVGTSTQLAKESPVILCSNFPS